MRTLSSTNREANCVANCEANCVDNRSQTQSPGREYTHGLRTCFYMQFMKVKHLINQLKKNYVLIFKANPQLARPPNSYLHSLVTSTHPGVSSEHKAIRPSPVKWNQTRYIIR